MVKVDQTNCHGWLIYFCSVRLVQVIHINLNAPQKITCLRFFCCSEKRVKSWNLWIFNGRYKALCYGLEPFYAISHSMSVLGWGSSGSYLLFSSRYIPIHSNPSQICWWHGTDCLFESKTHRHIYLKFDLRWAGERYDACLWIRLGGVSLNRDCCFGFFFIASAN